MKDFLANLGALIAVLSGIAFVISLFMLFFKKTRSLAIKILIISVIAFIIGFSTCLANFSLNLH